MLWRLLQSIVAVLLPIHYLYEPNAAILKSGGFHQVSVQLNVFKLLILLGADIQAVGNDNRMPLNVALEAAEHATTSDQVVNSGERVKYLRKLEAVSWLILAWKRFSQHLSLI